MTQALLKQPSEYVLKEDDDAEDIVSKALEEFTSAVDERLTELEKKSGNTTPPANDAEALDTKAFEVVKARLDELEKKTARPVTTGPKVAMEAEETKAYAAYLSTGRHETKSLTTADDTSDHILAPEDMQAEFIRNLVEFSPIRSIADVRTTTSGTVILPKRTGITNAAWVGETAERTTSEPTFAQQKLPIHELATMVDISLQLAEDSANVLAEVNTALAEDFGQTETLAFVEGTGAANGISRKASWRT